MKNLCLKLGIAFAIISILSIFTIFIPMFTVFPSEILNLSVDNLFDNLAYQTLGNIVLLVLTLLLITTLLIIFNKIKNLATNKQEIKISTGLIMMIILYFVVHNWGYYLFLAMYNFPLDALNTISSVTSFIFTSPLLALTGYFMDKSWQNLYDKN